jgi:hypothetical protein
MRRIMFLSVASLAPPYFSTLSHIRHDFQKKVVERKVISSTTSDTFLILRIIQRDIITNYVRIHVKYALFLSDFKDT